MRRPVILLNYAAASLPAATRISLYRSYLAISSIFTATGRNAYAPVCVVAERNCTRPTTTCGSDQKKLKLRYEGRSDDFRQVYKTQDARRFAIETNRSSFAPLQRRCAPERSLAKAQEIQTPSCQTRASEI